MGVIDDQIDVIFKTTNDKFWTKDFAGVDLDLTNVDVTKEELPILIGWLSACYRVSDKLQQYKSFLERVTEEIKRREPDVSEKRLKGLVGGFELPYRPDRYML